MLTASPMTLLRPRIALPCSCSFRSLPAACRGRSRGLAVRAQEGQQPQESAASSAADDRESTLEALEASVRARRGAKAAQMEMQRPEASSMRGGQQQKVVWKEGQLLPEGWDEMDVPTKMFQLYAGERGFMFWANKAAWASIIGLLVLWVVFRFLGPALGLYTLTNDFSQPNF